MSQAVPDVETRIGYAVKRLQQAVRAAAERHLRPLGPTMPQYAALLALATRPGLSNSELARRCFVTRQTMNDLLAGLQRADLITRAAHPHDGRVRQIELTASAHDLLGRADHAVAAVEQQMTMGLNAAERRQLLDMLQSCTANLERVDVPSRG